MAECSAARSWTDVAGTTTLAVLSNTTREKRSSARSWSTRWCAALRALAILSPDMEPELSMTTARSRGLRSVDVISRGLELDGDEACLVAAHGDRTAVEADVEVEAVCGGVHDRGVGGQDGGGGATGGVTGGCAAPWPWSWGARNSAPAREETEAQGDAGEVAHEGLRWLVTASKRRGWSGLTHEAEESRRGSRGLIETP